PGAFVTLVGRDLPRRYRDAWRTLPVRWLGVVEDVRPFLARAAALVFAPPRNARTGTALKISEALAAGTPVVSTPEVAEELGLIPGVHAVVSGDSAGLAHGVCRLVEDEDFAARIVANAHRWAREHL